MPGQKTTWCTKVVAVARSSSSRLTFLSKMNQFVDSLRSSWPVQVVLRVPYSQLDARKCSLINAVAVRPSRQHRSSQSSLLRFSQRKGPITCHVHHEPCHTRQLLFRVVFSRVSVEGIKSILARPPYCGMERGFPGHPYRRKQLDGRMDGPVRWQDMLSKIETSKPLKKLLGKPS